MSATIEAVTQNKNDIPWNKHVRQKQKPGDWAVSGIINVLLLLTIVAVLYPAVVRGHRIIFKSERRGRR